MKIIVLINCCVWYSSRCVCVMWLELLVRLEIDIPLSPVLSVHSPEYRYEILNAGDVLHAIYWIR